MDAIISQVEFYTKSGVIDVSNQGAEIKKYIYALVNSNIEFNESSREAIHSFVKEIKFLGRGAKLYNSFCRDLISKEVSSEELVETVRDEFEEFSYRTNKLEKNVADFISENDLTVHLENKTVSITKKYEAEMNPEQLHEQASGEQAAFDKSSFEEFSEQFPQESGGEQAASENPTHSESLEQAASEKSTHSESGGEQVASENPTCSESFSTESLAVSAFSDKNLLADSILCEIGFPLYSNKKGLHSKKFSHSYTSAIGQPELKITVTKVPSGKYKVFFGVSCDLNLSFSNIKKIPFEKQNRINLRIKNTTVKAYCSLDTPTSEVSVSIGQMFKVNNYRCGISGNFTFKEKKFQPQNFSFQTQVMTAPIVKTVKSNTCCMITPSLGVEIFPFLDVNTLTNTNISEKSNNLLVQAENRTPVGLEAENSISENIAHTLETRLSQPLATLSENYEIHSESMGIVMVQSKPEQGIAADPNPPSGAFIQRESNTISRVGVFGVALIIGYICIRYVKKCFWRKNPENL